MTDKREELIGLRKQVQKVIEDGRAFPADVLSAQIVLVFEQAHTPTEAYEKPLHTSPEPVKNGGDSLHVTPTDDEREWSTEDRREAEAEAKRRFMEWDGSDDEGVQRFGAGSVNGFILGAEWWESRRTVQGEPTDAQVNAALGAYIKSSGVHPGREHMRAALRAAAATQEREPMSEPTTCQS